MFRQHFTSCFIDDAYGLQNIERIGEDNIAYECDYPHSDTLWPHVPERLWETINHLTDAQIDKITHGNAIRDFKSDLFAHHKREDMTVAALRAKAQDVDTSVRSSGGAAPLAEGEVARAITSGDIVQMFVKHAETA